MTLTPCWPGRSWWVLEASVVSPSPHKQGVESLLWTADDLHLHTSVMLTEDNTYDMRLRDIHPLNQFHFLGHSEPELPGFCPLLINVRNPKCKNLNI